MTRGFSLVALQVAAILSASAGAAQTSAPAQSELAAVLNGLAARTQQYYDRFISIICTETVRSQDLRFTLAPLGKPRVTVFELSVSRNSEARHEDDFRVDRTLLSVNGKAARKNQEPGCTDPKTGSPEPLGFLLARNQPRYRFALDEQAAGGPVGTRALSFAQWPPDRVKVTWAGNCFNTEGGGEEGRIWFDPATFDVLQLYMKLSNPINVPMPAGLIGVQASIRVERWEMTVHFDRVPFEKPDEVVLLPESIETLAVIRGAPSLRSTQTLTNFRRFLSESKIRAITF
jgi:hypothetical protein